MHADMDLNLLKSARVVGMTTTGVASKQELVAAIGPKVQRYADCTFSFVFQHLSQRCTITDCDSFVELYVAHKVRCPVDDLCMQYCYVPCAVHTTISCITRHKLCIVTLNKACHKGHKGCNAAVHKGHTAVHKDQCCWVTSATCHVLLSRWWSLRRRLK